MSCAKITNIILDMDGTLLDHVLLYFDDIDSHEIIPIARPYLNLFMKYVFNNFERVSIWTAGTKEWFDKCYEKILKPSIPEGRNFHFIKTRSEYNYQAIVKPLEMIYHEYHDLYNFSNTLIIDDNPYTFVDNPEQALHIKPFFYERLPMEVRENLDKHDFELYNMILILNNKKYPGSIPFIESSAEDIEDESELWTLMTQPICKSPSQVFDDAEIKAETEELYNSVSSIEDW
jgi:hypothetical protein